MTHFGCMVKTDKLYLTRDNYVTYDRHFREWCQNASEGLNMDYDDVAKTYLYKVMLNYDLNMAYYESLDQDAFNEFIDNTYRNNPEYVTVDDLNDYKIPGVYIQVLGKYKKVYVGISKKSIKTRIQTHWGKTKDVFRMLWGKWNESIISIDSFRVMDTTDIFIYKPSLNSEDREKLLDLEYLLEKKVPHQYKANRISGGIEALIPSITGNAYNSQYIDQQEYIIRAQLPAFTEEEMIRISKDFSTKDALVQASKKYNKLMSRWHEYYEKKKEDDKKAEEQRQKELEAAYEEEKRLFREKVKEEKEYLDQLGFDPDKDFPGMFEYTTYMDDLHDIIRKSLKYGIDIKVYKGYEITEIRKMYRCYRAGICDESEVKRIATEIRADDLSRYINKYKKKHRLS